MQEEKKAVWGWVLYDWANSTFATTVMAGFFPVFFKQYWSYGVDVNMSTAQLGIGNSVAGLVVALMAPVLGAVADRGGLKKKLLAFFAYLGVLMTATLALVGKGRWELAIFVYVLGTIGFSGANVFYDSLLPDVASEEKIDHVSSLGFSMGYLGGGLLFLVNVLMTLMPQKFGLADAAAAVRASFISVALWWGGFTIFILCWVPEEKATSARKDLKYIKAGFAQLGHTFKKVRHLRVISLFLLAFWFYNDGVNTIIRMAVDYGLSLGFHSNDLILALLLVQFVGFPAALMFGKLGQNWGTRKAIHLAIGIYLMITLGGTLMTKRHEFYILAILIGLVQGGIQALSRSYYARLIPKNKTAEYYGFYDMMGKFAVILGPAMMGMVGLLIRNLFMPPSPTHVEIQHVSQLASRWSLGSISLLFIIGGILLYFVDEKKAKEQLIHLS